MELTTIIYFAIIFVTIAGTIILGISFFLYRKNKTIDNSQEVEKVISSNPNLFIVEKEFEAPQQSKKAFQKVEKLDTAKKTVISAQQKQNKNLKFN